MCTLGNIERFSEHRNLMQSSLVLANLMASTQLLSWAGLQHPIHLKVLLWQMEMWQWRWLVGPYSSLTHCFWHVKS